MKRPITPAYTFTPGSSTLNLSGIAGFDVRALFAVIDLKTGALIYAPLAGYGYSALSGTTLTLQAPMTGLSGADPLMILYDDGTGVPALGQATAAASLPVVLSSDGPFATNFGLQADTAATADTGSWSLIALVKRSLGRWTTLLGLLPASLGQKAMAAAFPVSIASDQSAIAVTIGKTATAGDAAITTGGTAQTLFSGATPANGWKVANPDVAEDLWVSDSTTAAPNGQGSYRVPAGGIVTTEPGEKPVGAVSVYAATTGHLITARSW